VKADRSRVHKGGIARVAQTRRFISHRTSFHRVVETSRRCFTGCRAFGWRSETALPQ
jgi:hypothetical protein